MAKTIKAERAEIKLGDISIEVFQMPSGEYRLSQSQVFEAVEVKMNDYPRFKKQNGLNAIPSMALNLPRFSVGGGTVKPLSIEQASIIWAVLSAQGNKIATGLIIASLAEAIERRADTAFNVIRTEKERDDRFKSRVEGRQIRRTFTDAISEYIDRHSGLSSNRVKFLYSNASDAVNRAVFARPAKRLCEDLRVSDRDLLRDCLTEVELRHIAMIEEEAMYIIDRDDIDPCEAVLSARTKFSFDISLRPEKAC